jgi:CRISPR/Cas system-associated endonuclease Cas1
MAIDFPSGNAASAFAAGRLGLQTASNGIAEAAVNIAQANQRQTPEEVLASAAEGQLGAVRQILPEPEDNLTNDLLSLQTNLLNAQASTRVLDSVDETVGRLLNALA